MPLLPPFATTHFYHQEHIPLIVQYCNTLVSLCFKFVHMSSSSAHLPNHWFDRELTRQLAMRTDAGYALRVKEGFLPFLECDGNAPHLVSAWRVLMNGDAFCQSLALCSIFICVLGCAGGKNGPSPAAKKVLYKVNVKGPHRDWPSPRVDPDPEQINNSAQWNWLQNGCWISLR